MGVSPRTVRIPARLRQLEGLDRGREWLTSLPQVVLELESLWSVHASTLEPFAGGVAAWTAPVTRADGSEAVLKVSWPHREAREEATALREWDGDGAVRLYAEDREHFALLLERCRPGTKLIDTQLPPADALRIGADILRRLWQAPADPSRYERVADVAAEWATQVRERMQRLRPPFDPGLVE